MKLYPKTYEDLYRQRPAIKVEYIGAVDGDIDGLTQQFKDFYQIAYRSLFDIAVRYLWLEKQVTFKGLRRSRRFRNGHVPDQSFGRYMMQIVGHDQASLTRSRWFVVTSAVVTEMFPEFLQRNPFDEPEYYRWPYEHVTLDFLTYSYQIHNRFELLEYADEKRMSFHDFKNWVNNYVLSYNDDNSDDIYSVSLNREGAPYIKRKGWESFDESRDSERTLNNEYAKEPKANNNELDQISP